MVRKWIQRSLVVVFVLSLVFVLKSVPREIVRAQALTPRAYFPLIFKSEPIRRWLFAAQERLRIGFELILSPPRCN